MSVVDHGIIALEPKAPTTIIDVMNVDALQPLLHKRTLRNTVAFIVEGRPVSVNHIYFTTPRGFRAMTAAGKKYKSLVGLMAKEAMMKSGFAKVEKKDVSVVLKFYFETKRGDVDNCTKGILDSMTEVVYGDDGQINDLHCFKFKDAKWPRVEIEVGVEG